LGGLQEAYNKKINILSPVKNCRNLRFTRKTDLSGKNLVSGELLES
jgi:hypothetical protein